MTEIPKNRFLISNLCDILSPYMSENDTKKVYAAYFFAAEAHEGIVRQSGEPYIFHPLEVAHILADMQMDAVTLEAALLHDVIEDTQFNKQAVVEQFGQKVADLVDGVSKFDKIDFASKEEHKAASFRKMMLASIRDVRVLLIKLADRLHNMRTLQAKDSASKQRIAQETLNVYAPIAKSLGIHKIYLELQELCFQSLYPWRYTVLNHHINVLCQNKQRVSVLEDLSSIVLQRLSQSGIHASITGGSKKHSYGIFCKMREKNLRFEQVKTLYTIRLVGDEINTCYQILGIIHTLYKPKPGAFKDYIAIPKRNGYQSLHTAIIGPYGVAIEVHICTQKMLGAAEYGIAYALYHNHDQQVDYGPWQWLRDLKDDATDNLDAITFFNEITKEFNPDEIYVYSPKGRLVCLPRGATALDFAYSIHSDIGHHAVSAVIDEQLCALNTPLQTGQMVSIETSPSNHPKWSWLNFAKTGRSCSNIRSYFNKLSKKDTRILGQRLLNEALLPYGKNLNDFNDPHIAQIFMGQNLEQLLTDIGLGKRLPQLVAKALCQTTPERDSPAQLIIQGTEGLAITLAKCCRPIPGDDIWGHINNGIMIHTLQCEHSRNKSRRNLQEWIDVSWAAGLLIESIVDIRVETLNKRGVLANVAGAIAKFDSNIEDVLIQKHEGDNSIMHFCITVSDKTHLTSLLNYLRKLDYVISAKRLKNGH